MYSRSPVGPVFVRGNGNRMSRVLIVEDHPDSCEAMRRLLLRVGHEVECAGDGRTALAALERFVPDVVLLDLMMPEMDGVSFLQIIRQKAQWQNLRVIVFSGFGEHVNAERLHTLGVGEILLKGNVSPQSILDLIGGPNQVTTKPN